MKKKAILTVDVVVVAISTVFEGRWLRRRGDEDDDKRWLFEGATVKG